MAVRRTLASLVVALCVTTAAHAQNYPLTETPATGACTRNQLTLALTGVLKVHQDGKKIELKETATAAHDFLERVVDPGSGVGVNRTVRCYKDAKVAIAVNGPAVQTTLRPAVAALVVAQRHRDQILAYSPKGQLTRDELHVLEHFDTLSLPALLPPAEVAAGATWKIATPVVQALCNFEGVTSQDLVGKLVEVKGGTAFVSVTGAAAGIDLGATVKVTVAATLEFDLAAKRVTKVTWKQTDDREQGPVSPAGAVELTYTLVRTVVETPAELNDTVLVQVPTTVLPPEEMKLLTYADPKGRYEMLHFRDWHLVGRTDEHMVMRLMDRGDFVAQVTVAPWKKTAPGKHMTGEEFKQVISTAPGWQVEAILDEDAKDAEVKDLQAGYWAYRVRAQGELDGVKALQYFYMLAGPQGDQLLLTFTMTPAQAQKLDTRDANLLRGVTFPRREEAEVKTP